MNVHDNYAGRDINVVVHYHGDSHFQPPPPPYRPPGRGCFTALAWFAGFIMFGLFLAYPSHVFGLGMVLVALWVTVKVIRRATGRRKFVTDSNGTTTTHQS